MRSVIVHYHLFKNAGSTVDHILQENFGDAWVGFDGPEAFSRISPAELAAFIVAHPGAAVVSSHQIHLPVPEIPGVSILPIVMLRHPLDRIRSVYSFERRQGRAQGPVSPGADHASRLSFADYLRWRLDRSRNGVINNFHSAWLLGEPRWQSETIDETAYATARDRLFALPFFGIVEEFDASMDVLNRLLARGRVVLKMGDTVMNRTEGREATLEGRLDAMRRELGDDLYAEAEARNAWDLKLYAEALEEFLMR